MDTIVIGEFPVYGALIMLVVDSLLYLLLAVYFGFVIEGLLAIILCGFSLCRSF